METSAKQEKIVSIIIPVYNAEKYLGYCLNSIVSQTYKNLEIILVNDGSTDDSIKICDNYAFLDSRVRVINIANRGVSNARNVGLKAATGEYIEFADADDVLNPQMVATLVDKMDTYQSDIIICGFEMVSLDSNQQPRDIIHFNSRILGEECVYTQKLFFEKLSCILWKTSLLECPWNKMFRKDIIENHNLQFPIDKSLGEDFCFNIDYFAYVNKAVILSDELYYYMQINQTALTRKYQANYFEDQLYLVKKFDDMVRKNIKPSKQERIYLAEYMIAKTIQSICHLFDKNCELNSAQKKARIADVINNSYIRDAVEIAEYIDERYLWIREAIEKSDVQKIYMIFKQNATQETKKQLENKVANDNELHPSYINKLLVKMCEIILRKHDYEILQKVKINLQNRGIKYTIKKIWRVIMKR